MAARSGLNDYSIEMTLCYLFNLPPEIKTTAKEDCDAEIIFAITIPYTYVGDLLLRTPPHRGANRILYLHVGKSGHM